MPDSVPTRAEVREETAEAVCEIAICLAQAIHELDPGAHRRMNFNAGLAYNRLLGEQRVLAADILYRFGRALMDRELFPEEEAVPEDAAAPQDADEEIAPQESG